MGVREDLAKVFEEIDLDGSGCISKAEIRAAVEKCGYKISDDDLKGIFTGLDEGGDGKITKDEFINVMEAAMDPQKHEEAIMRRAFNHFDQDGNGTIDTAELSKVFEELGGKLPPDQIERMMQLLDQDQSGSVNYEEFFAAFAEGE